MKILILVLGMLFGSAANAQDISMKLDQIKPGSYVILRSAGGFASHVFRGKSGRYFIVDVVMDKNPNAPRLSRDKRDANGNSVERVYSDGTKVSYKPHNCQRVVGRCTFVEIGKSYRTNMERTNTPTKGGFKFEQYAISGSRKRVFIRNGTAKLDAMGVILEATENTREHDGIWLKQAQAVYK